MTDPHARLVRDLLASAGGEARVAADESRPWASATFTGARHRLSLALPPAAADRLARGLADRDLVIPGHLVAEIALVARRDQPLETALEIEALTIEQG